MRCPHCKNRLENYVMDLLEIATIKSVAESVVISVSNGALSSVAAICLQSWRKPNC